MRRSAAANEEIAGLQTALDEMLEGVVEELGNTTSRTQAIEASLEGALRDEVDQLFELLEEAGAKIEGLGAASEALRAKVATDAEERMARVMEVLEQEVEAREVGVDRLTTDLVDLTERLESELDALRADVNGAVVRPRERRAPQCLGACIP